jgi:hypothetical protein
MSGVYSLVNVPCLVRDMARHPRGGALAADLLRATALGPAEFASLERLRVVPGAAQRRAELVERSQAAPRALQVLAAARDVASTMGIDGWAAASDVLDIAPIGGLVELVDVVRDEICAAAWRRSDGLAVATWPTALDIVADGVRATYASHDHGDVAMALGRPWRRWLASRQLPSVDLDPASDGVIARVSSASVEQLARAADGLRRQRAAGWSWALAMHDACWAIELTGRERSALVAQMHGVRAVLRAHAGRRPAPDVVAAVVMSVHAHVVADVLAADVVAAMTAPVDAALG